MEVVLIRGLSDDAREGEIASLRKANRALRQEIAALREAQAGELAELRAHLARIDAVVAAPATLAQAGR